MIPLGAVAQLGERCVRNAEVGSSILLGSTNEINGLHGLAEPKTKSFMAIHTIVNYLAPTSVNFAV